MPRRSCATNLVPHELAICLRGRAVPPRRGGRDLGVLGHRGADIVRRDLPRLYDTEGFSRRVVTQNKARHRIHARGLVVDGIVLFHEGGDGGLGDFNGIDKDGVVDGLLFPASLAFSQDGKNLYVSNLTLFLPYAGAQPAVDFGMDAASQTLHRFENPCGDPAAPRQMTTAIGLGTWRRLQMAQAAFTKAAFEGDRATTIKSARKRAAPARLLGVKTLARISTVRDAFIRAFMSITGRAS